MPVTTSIPPLTLETHADLLARYNTASDPETRTRYQMVVLAVEHDWSPEQIGSVVKRSHDTVLRVLHRFLAGGLAAIPRRTAPGGPPTITPVWEAELLRVIEDDPHDHGVRSANWTTQLLAEYLEGQTRIAVDQETVRRHLHRLGYVCKRPVWVVAHKAAERPDYVGKGSGERSS
jgi:transposase